MKVAPRVRTPSVPELEVAADVEHGEHLEHAIPVAGLDGRRPWLIQRMDIIQCPSKGRVITLVSGKYIVILAG